MGCSIQQSFSKTYPLVLGASQVHDLSALSFIGFKKSLLSTDKGFYKLINKDFQNLPMYHSSILRESLLNAQSMHIYVLASSSSRTLQRPVALMVYTMKRVLDHFKRACMHPSFCCKKFPF